MRKQILIVGYMLLLFSETAESDKKHEGKKKNWHDSECRCGISNTKQAPVVRAPRVVGGSLLKPAHKYPWMVAIFKNGKQFCAGALISQYYILSAAHCFARGKIKSHLDSIQKMCSVHGLKGSQPCYQNPSVFQIVSTGPSNYLNFTAIESFTIHPKFDFTQKSFDMALVKLEKKILCSKFIRPICLSWILQLKPGMDVVASGWGRAFQGAPAEKPLILKEAKMKILSASKCASHNFNHKVNPCVKGYNQGMCMGDSGSPLAVKRSGKFFLIGVLSYGMSLQCDPTEPQYFSDVRSFLPWILDEIKK